MAEMGRRWSPYNYGENNPIKNIDPDGMWTETANGYTTSDASEISAFFEGNNSKQQDDDKKKGKKKEDNNPDKTNNNPNINEHGRDTSFDWIPGWGAAGEMTDAMYEGDPLKFVFNWGLGVADLSMLKSLGSSGLTSLSETVAGWFTKKTAVDLAPTLAKMDFKALQAQTKTFSQEMNTFFSSEGKTVPSKAGLQTYKELITRVLNRTGGAYQKVTENMKVVYTDRLKWINNALKYEK